MRGRLYEMTVSQPVEDLDELIAYITQQKQLAWGLLDNSSGSLLDKGGDEARFGLDSIDIGKGLSDHFLCLEGVFPLNGKPYEVYELEFTTTMFVNIYCLPTNAGDLLIIQDISEITLMKKVLHGKTQEIIRQLENNQTTE